MDQIILSAHVKHFFRRSKILGNVQTCKIHNYNTVWQKTFRFGDTYDVAYHKVLFHYFFLFFIFKIPYLINSLVKFLI
jgi:hypothetical protein